MNTFLTLTFILALSNTVLPAVSLKVKDIDADKRQVEIGFSLNPGQYLVKESLLVTSNMPSVTVSELQSSEKPVSFLDESSQKKKEGYTGNVTFTLLAQKKHQDQFTNAAVHLHYAYANDKSSHEELIPLTFSSEGKSSDPVQDVSEKSSAPAHSIPAPACDVQQPSLLGSLIQKAMSYVRSSIAHIKDSLNSLFTSTGSGIIRFISAFILGILLSLTPCIYPMIPITVGILQASGTKSAFQNFLLALFYTLGISLTFASLGFLAALGSCVFGEMQGSPFFVIPLALLLFYFALTMFDIVQLKIPRWLQPKANVKGGSKLSAFIFGALSGTVASPCLSPGLILILNYVAKISSQSFTGYFEGFLLLFIFGIGSSLPLLIIGTFSGSLSVLPKAGMWMVEIKKLVGIMLIAMAFYHLSHLERFLPWYILSWIIALAFIVLGIYYFASVHAHDKKWMRAYKNIMGVIMIIVACLSAAQALKALVDKWHPETSHSIWLHEYGQARQQALNEHKLLFIDIGATYCGACKTLDATIFSQKIILDALKRFVQVKIDSDVHIQSYEQVKLLFGAYIDGFPTYLLIDPTSQKVVKKWSVELDELSLNAISDLFKKAAEEYVIS
jgi:thiol:disulfide interchange protein